MKKTILFAAAIAAIASSAAQADGWKFAPIATDKDFKLAPTLALTANRVLPKDGDAANAYGIDFNFNCGLLQDPKNRMRTHLIATQSNESGVKRTSFELSPRYTMPLNSGFSAGVGPSLASFQVKNDAGTFEETYFGYGVAAGLNYRAGAYYSGLDVRYHNTVEKNNTKAEGTTLGLKVGINF